ncbi:MAG: TatD family deoxyribonuclease [Balneolaceae bacterium]|nr:MAG: TatD family deoxyribonuclease [Balneolaceae bacterium]
MVDTHCHIYLPQFQKDIQKVLDRAAHAGITDIMMPAIDIGSLEQMDALTHPHIRFHKMIGIHPCDVNTTPEGPGKQLFERGDADEIIAIGETGLDYYWSKEHISAQQQSLREHCQAAKTLDKPVILHNRESTEDLLDIIKEQQDGRLRGIWHCFNGTPEQGRRALDLGLYLGIGGVVTFKNAGVDRVVADLPPDRLVLETDAPYLAPVPKRGKRNEPSFMKYTAQKLSELFGISLEETDRITTENARRLFRLS